MTRTDLRITFEIPGYCTPEQALVVYELLHGPASGFLSHYQTQIIDEFREQHRPSQPQETGSDPASEIDRRRKPDWANLVARVDRKSASRHDDYSSARALADQPLAPSAQPFGLRGLTARAAESGSYRAVN